MARIRGVWIANLALCHRKKNDLTKRFLYRYQLTSLKKVCAYPKIFLKEEMRKIDALNTS
jgi:hypothetical protein